jgi:hypothetical protein
LFRTTSSVASGASAVADFVEGAVEYFVALAAAEIVVEWPQLLLVVPVVVAGGDGLKGFVDANEEAEAEADDDDDNERAAEIAGAEAEAEAAAGVVGVGGAVSFCCPLGRYDRASLHPRALLADSSCSRAASGEIVLMPGIVSTYFVTLVQTTC